MLVLDFDGTLTDAESEGVRFTEGFLRDLATLTGHSLERIEGLHERFHREILAEPTRRAWMLNGVAVAPATVDPYLFIKPIAEMILDELGVVMDERVRENLITHILCRDNYRLTKAHFRPGARELLNCLYEDRARINVAIVTDWDTMTVLAKIETLALDYKSGYRKSFVDFWRDCIHGGARKYVVDDSKNCENGPLTFSVPGLDRPVFCGRPHYYGILSRLLKDRVLDWPDLTVVGDSLEMDLALPLSLGANVGIMRSDRTPPCELDFLAGHSTAKVLEGIEDILPFYSEMRAAV